VLHEQAWRHTPADLDMAVSAGLGASQHLPGEIAGRDLDVPAGKRWKMFLKEHGDAVRFLTARASRAPHVQAPFPRSVGDERRQNGLSEHAIHTCVSEEIGLVVRQRLNDLPVELAKWTMTQLQDHLLE